MSLISEEALAKIREISIVDYAYSKGYDIHTVGHNFKIDGFGGLNIRGDGTKFNCFSQEKGGGIIQFVMFMENCSWRKAVDQLIDFSNIVDHEAPPLRPRKENLNINKKTDLQLPEKNNTFKHLYAYLIKSRRISKTVIDYFVHNHTLYEDIRHNCVFIGADQKNKPQNAFMRGTFSNNGKSFKGSAEGSDKRFPFYLAQNPDATECDVFEAPIDLLSYLTLMELHDLDEYIKNRHFISLNGVASGPLLHYLDENPAINKIKFCLDNDLAGQEAITNLMTSVIEKFGKDRFTFSIKTPQLKDYNEDLICYVSNFIENKNGWNHEAI